MEAGTKPAQVLPESGVKGGGTREGCWLPHLLVGLACSCLQGLLWGRATCAVEESEQARARTCQPASLSLMGGSANLRLCFFQATSGEVTCREGPRTTLGLEESCRIQVQKSRSGKWEGEPIHEKK